MFDRDDGYEHQLEQDYAAALEELERKSAYNAALYQAVIGLKRDRVRLTRSSVLARSDTPSRRLVMYM